MATHDIVDKEYLQLCSEKTLQTNKNGFFLQFSDFVAEEVGEKWLKNVFGKLKTDKERIRIIYQDNKITPNLIKFLSRVQEIYRQKSAEVSKARQGEAEACVEAQKALNLYSQSILKAPHGPNLALLLLGRAKLLFSSMKDTIKAKSDLQLCLQHSLPETHKAEALVLLEKCETAQKPTEKSRIQPQVSEKIAIRRSSELGRFAVAKGPIKTGETLVVEAPEVSCLLPEKFGTHCHHCYARLVAPIGCADCSSVAFCKVDCLEAAHYHKYECKFLDLLIGSGMSILSHAALRAITQRPLNEVLENYKNPSQDKLRNLCANAAQRQPTDFLQRTLMAAFLLRILQKANYFGNSPTIEPNEQELKIGEMLLVYLQILQFNAHEIYETLCEKNKRLKTARQVYVGVGVYPTVALFNHDCYPSVTRYFDGKKIVIVATRPLSPNQEISENYGPIFTWRNLTERQRSLTARYWFKCRCVACEEDWPTFKMGIDTARVRCPTKSCHYLFSLKVPKNQNKCPNCKKEVDLNRNIEEFKWCEQQYDQGLNLIDTNNAKAALAILCPALDTFHRISAPPHRETHLAQEVVRLCLADSGNTYELLVNKSTK